MKLIVGLGNPGKEYELTRHNIGYITLDAYLKDQIWKSEKNADIIKTNQAIFIKPTTYMNLSGEAVAYYTNYYKITPDKILVIQDDLDSPLGNIKIKNNSSSGGHNGIKDIINHLHTDSFYRLKIGISRPNKDTKDYVLSKFSIQEQEIINNLLPTTKSIITAFLNEEPIETIKSKYNLKAKLWNL